MKNILFAFLLSFCLTFTVVAKNDGGGGNSGGNSGSSSSSAVEELKSLIKDSTSFAKLKSSL